MAEHWIDAATALDTVAGTTNNMQAAIESICERAYVGLIKAKAKHYLEDTKRAEDIIVPSGFWWAKGQAALDQNWATGDFSTWINRRVHLQAFGVRFDLPGILDTLPVERRSTVARQLSVAGNPAWVSAREARRFAYEKAGTSVSGADRIIFDHAKLGLVTARAMLAQRIDPRNGDLPSWGQREWDIREEFWRQADRKGQFAQDWERGEFEGPWEGPLGPFALKLTGVYFLAESLQVLLPAQSSVGGNESETKVQGKGGGQPPRAFWDEMLCDIWALIYQGAFTPKLQKDVEDAMLTWAERKGHKVGEATVRPKARLLFARYHDEAENFLAEE